MVIRSISNGIRPFHSTRSRANGLIPRTGQPRLVPPHSSFPPGVNSTFRMPVDSPSRKG